MTSKVDVHVRATQKASGHKVLLPVKLVK